MTVARVVDVIDVRRDPDDDDDDPHLGLLPGGCALGQYSRCEYWRCHRTCEYILEKGKRS